MRRQIAVVRPKLGQPARQQLKVAGLLGGHIDPVVEKPARQSQADEPGDKIQQLTIDRVMYAPVMDFSALMGIGPRVTKHTIGDVWMSPFPSYEDLEIKG